ncbi:MAG: hypothetical protein AUI15_36645 [Actinobacteria bacterium 13_2_20CM_2_66_6]|nr:MAG: hypothetical protein AUI15_36645 [Actinobacteria bacterium 13_2_20CM_2_66_6]
MTTNLPVGSLTVADGISILPALKLVPALEPFKAAATDLEAQGERAVIDSDETYQKGSDFLTVCDQQWRQLEDLRKATKGPVDDYAKFIQTLFLPIQGRFLAVKDGMRARMLAYQKAAEARRLEAERKVREAQEAAALELADQAAKGGNTAVADAILEAATAAPPARAPVRKIGGSNTFGRSTHIAETWQGRIVEPMEALKAIVAGQLPITLIEWRQVELNAVARQVKVEGIFRGLKVEKVEGLRQR